MDYTEIVTKIIQSFIDAWNRANYSDISDALAENVVVITEAINTKDLQLPPIKVVGIEDVVTYWKEMREKFKAKIEHYKIIEVGSVSKVICRYKGLDITIWTEVSINEYGKITKIINRTK